MEILSIILASKGKKIKLMGMVTWAKYNNQRLERVVTEIPIKENSKISLVILIKEHQQSKITTYILPLQNQMNQPLLKFFLHTRSNMSRNHLHIQWSKHWLLDLETFMQLGVKIQCLKPLLDRPLNQVNQRRYLICMTICTFLLWTANIPWLES